MIEESTPTIEPGDQIQCMFDCGQPATKWIQWGTLDGQQGNVCDQHEHDCWEAVQVQLKAGINFWRCEPVSN